MHTIEKKGIRKKRKLKLNKKKPNATLLKIEQ